jgi:aminomethyltransferase
MPLYYQGIKAEHEAVRTSAGVFDVSHMGIFTAVGGTAGPLLARRTTANVPELKPGHCRYTFLLNYAGAIVDDLLVTRTDDAGEAPPVYLVVPNAGQADRIFTLLSQHRKPDVRLERWNHRAAILAVQGPRSASILEEEFGWQLGGLKFYEGRRFLLSGRKSGSEAGTLGWLPPTDLEHSVWVSRSGYTGELGFEVFVGAEHAVDCFDRLLARGVVPCGLGARDTLRLEKGFLLSGQDFHEDRTPLEAGQDRFVSFDHAFVGREALEEQQRQGVPVRLRGLRTESPTAIPRHGTPVLSEGQPVATVTSGTLSPSLGYGIALAYLPPALQAPDTPLTLDVRGRMAPARVVPLPFLRAPSNPR